MNKINILSEDLANKIAAGEVVERVGNVVKELVENSIDAGAKTIEIKLEDSGTKSIKILDDGSGMNKIDAKNAFLRHATSKIKTDDDLFFISSLGFRGEAIPSIASVSKVTLITSTGEEGTKIVVNGGKFIEETKAPARKGTMIEVRDLFYNTPARLKYLKSDNSELANVTNYVEKLSLAKENISFTLINNDKVIIKTSGSNNLLKTIHELYGIEVSKNMMEVKGENNDYSIYGYVGSPSVLRSSRNYLTTIVNDRVVKNYDLNKIINDAYFTYKPDNKFPIVVLKIDTDPTLIDVNIHPTKQDIKFSKINELEDLIFENIRNTLYKENLIPKVEVKTKDTYKKKEIKKEYPEIINNTEVNEVQEEFNFTEDKNNEVKQLELYPIGLVFGTYIVAQNEEGMYLIDHHAAHERINYEKILNNLNNNEKNIIDMLVPLTIEFSPSDYLIFNEKKDILIDMGFNLEEFGINTIVIKSHPIWLLEGYEDETIRGIIDIVISLPKEFDYVKFNHSIAAEAACKKSVKGNTSITISEMENIIKDLFKCDNPYNCPHGRPTIITFTLYELEKMFKRTGSS